MIIRKENHTYNPLTKQKTCEEQPKYLLREQYPGIKLHFVSLVCKYFSHLLSICEGLLKDERNTPSHTCLPGMIKIHARLETDR